MSNLDASVKCFVDLHYGESGDEDLIEFRLPFALTLKRDYAYWYSCFIKEVKRKFYWDVGDYMNIYFFNGPKEAEKYLQNLDSTRRTEVKNRAANICKSISRACIHPGFD